MDAISNVTKKCFKCGETKPIDEFHKHKRMKDGHLNKCAKCVVKDVADWRKKQQPGFRNAEYIRSIELGTRKKPKFKHTGCGRDPIRRKVAASKYAAKRKSKTALKTEFDEFVFDECITLNFLRKAVTGFDWHLDHVVPINHRSACGLHVAANFQSVPGLWNTTKRNASMDSFWPLPSVANPTRNQAAIERLFV